MRFSITLILFILFSFVTANAQKKPLKDTQKPIRSQPKPAPSTVKDLKEGDLPIKNSNNLDSIAPQKVIDINYSKDPLEAQLDYSAKDSMHFDVVENKIYLWGEAIVKYEKMELKAGHIVFDQKNNLIIAEGVLDSLGKISQIPDFTDGSQSFKAKKMKYNFKSKKGVISDVTTQENDLYIHSERTIFQSFSEKDSIYKSEDVIFSENSIFTTCDHDEPHFGICSRKQKVIANKLIIVGPSNLEIAGVKTPLWLPFGFFPIKKGQRSGLIFPRNYENSGDLGFGLRNVGYYWGINDKYDYQLTGDIYTRGTWRLNSTFRYNIKYRFNGRLTLGYAWNNLGDGKFADDPLKKDIQKNFNVNWVMNQSNKSHPTRTFTASVDFQINGAQRQNNNNIDNVQNNILRSNISYNQNFPGKPLSLTASINHSQNTNTNDFTIRAPNLRFNVRRVYPFKKKKRIGKEKWFEKIGVNYSLEGLGQITTKDSLLFEKETWDDFKYGLRHKSTIEAPIRFWKNFSLNPNISYSETWLFESIEKQYLETIDTIETIYVNPNDPTDTIEGFDYITSGATNVLDINGFKPLRQFNAGFNISTDVYSTLLFKKGRLKGLRWTMRPSIGFSYTPDYTNERWGYFDYYRIGDAEDDTRYSVFEGNVFGQNPSTQGKQMNLTYNISNFFEGKYESRKDSINPIKRIKLFDNISINGDYNFARDSLKFSMVRMAGTARFFDRITTITISAAFDPYIQDKNGKTINTFRWEAEKRFLRFDQFNLRISNRVGLKDIKKWFKIKDKKNNSSSSSPPKVENGRGNNPSQQIPSSSGADFIRDLSLEHLMNIRFEPDTVIISSNTLSLRTQLNLSAKWQFSLGLGYDFKSKNLTYPDINVSRDLHCWNMGLGWQPTRGTYSFFLKVNPGSLDFISVPWQKNQFDSGFGRL